MTNPSLKERLLKNSTISETALLSNSILLNEKDVIPTPVPMINVALSGVLDGGLQPGILTLAGPSKHFKSAFSLLMASSYIAKYPDAVVLFYDTEFGTPLSYFDSFGLIRDNVVHTPLLNIEQLKHDAMKQLEGIKRGDHVIIIIDSIGNIASKKEVDDAIEGKGTADMTRAKQLKSFGRMVTPYLTLRNIPLIAINHVYKEIGTMYPKDIVSGGTGMYLSSDNIWILGRQADKGSGATASPELEGYHFIINVEKSRYVKEKSVIPITVKFDGGIDRWSGLLELAAEAGIVEASGSWIKYDGKSLRKKDFDDDFYKELIAREDFKEYVRKEYQLSASSLIDTTEDE